MNKKIEVVFKKEIEGLAHFGEIRKVSAGYAHNFLIPKGLALYKSDLRTKEILRQVEEKSVQKEESKKKLENLAKKINGKKIEIEVKTTEKGKLYAAVRPAEILKAISKSAKIKLDEDQIKIKPIKELGRHEIEIKFDQQITSKIILEIKGKK